MPQTNPNVGRALAELSAGTATPPDVTPVALAATNLEDPAGTTVVTPTGQVLNQVLQVVGPTAQPAPGSAALGQATNGALTLQQAEEIVRTLNPAALHIGPAATAPAVTPQANQPTPDVRTSVTSTPSVVPGPINLDQLQASAMQASMMPAQPSTTSTNGAITNGAITNGVAPAGPTGSVPMQTMQPLGPTGDAPVHVQLADTTLVDTPIGRVPWGEAKGNMMRRNDFVRQQREILETKRSVESQQHLISKVAGSKFGAAFTATLNAGGTEDDAINAGMSAAGRSLTAPPAPQPEAPLTPPDENDPQFAQKYATYLTALSSRTMRDEMRRELEPLRQTLAAEQATQRQVQTQATLAQREAQAIAQHNQELFRAYVEPYIPQGLDANQRMIVTQHLEQTAQQNGIPIDLNRRMYDSDFRLLAHFAFPNDQLPPQLVQRLTPAASGYAPYGQQPFGQQSYYSVPQYAQPSPQYVPAIQQPVQQTQQLQPQVPSLATLPDWQKTALLQQATATIQNYRSVLGGAQQVNGVPTLPGIPPSPALQAGPNPSAAQVGSGLSPVSPLARPEESIRQRLQSIPRAA